ncbi:MAG: hypothetical protein ACJAZO_002499 [Myxococcota bacterium]|jgi:hypothetical protein
MTIIRIEPTDTDERIEVFMEGRNPQFGRCGILRRDIIFDHLCIADGPPTQGKYDATRNLRTLERGLAAPPVGSRR